MNLIFEDVKATYGGKAYVVAIVPSATKLCMTEDIPYVFHQNNDYLYLSGCLSPDTLLILSGNSEENLCSTLFVRKRDAHSDTWEGPRIGTEFLQSSMLRLNHFIVVIGLYSKQNRTLHVSYSA